MSRYPWIRSKLLIAVSFCTIYQLKRQCIPVGLDLECIIYANQVEDHPAETNGHVQGESCGSRTSVLDIYLIESKQCDEDSAEEIHTESDPPIQIPRCARNATVMVYTLERFFSKCVLRSVCSDRHL